MDDRSRPRVAGPVRRRIAISTGLIRELLPERRVPVAVALLGGIIPIASGIGALVAGVLLDQSGWRLMFAAAVVLGTAAALLSQFCIPATPGITPRPSVDLVGAIMLVPATAGVCSASPKAASGAGSTGECYRRSCSDWWHSRRGSGGSGASRNPSSICGSFEIARYR